MDISVLGKERGNDSFCAGVRIGGRVTASGVSDEIKEFCSTPLTSICYILLPRDTTAEYMFKWAAEFRETKTYFFLNPFYSDVLTREDILKVAEIAGEYYLGALVSPLNEYGTRTATIAYCSHEKERMREQAMTDLREAFDSYIAEAKEKTKKSKELYGGMTSVIEATPLLKYLYETDIDIVISEFLTGNLDYQVAYARGAARGYGRDKWASLIAHEWYGGIRNDDPLKFKRLKLIYDYLYMAGCNCTFIESGEFSIRSYGYYYDINHKYCKEYRRIREDFTKSVADDVRPTPNPMCKVGIVHGNYDAFVGFFSSSLMYHRNIEEWVMQDSERSWHLLENIKNSTLWHNPHEYGDYAYCNAPGYGDYEIVPIESSIEALCEYEYLIFLGWNSMTEEYYEKLKEYVRRGGNLIMSAAHLNTNTVRDGKYLPIYDGKLSDFLGCDIVGTERRDGSVKFVRDSMMKNVLYPVVQNEDQAVVAAAWVAVDPLFPSGNIDFVNINCKSCEVIAYANVAKEHIRETDPPAVIENKYGKGVVSLITELKYPGNSENRLFYSYIMRAIFSASHRGCDVKVIANDRIKFTVYDAGDGKRKIYLLNTDFSLPSTVIVKTDVEEIKLTLDSLERKEITVSTRVDN